MTGRSRWPPSETCECPCARADPHGFGRPGGYMTPGGQNRRQWVRLPARRPSTVLAMRACRVSAFLASSTQRTHSLRCVYDSPSKNCRAALSAPSASSRSSGSVTSRGAVSSSMSTSTASPAATPAASRFSALSGSRNCPPRDATVVRYVCPPIVIRTDGCRPESSAAITSSGTTMPVAVLPPSSTVVRNLMAPSLSATRCRDLPGEVVAVLLRPEHAPRAVERRRRVRADQARHRRVAVAHVDAGDLVVALVLEAGRAGQPDVDGGRLVASLAEPAHRHRTVAVVVIDVED